MLSLCSTFASSAVLSLGEGLGPSHQTPPIIGESAATCNRGNPNPKDLGGGLQAASAQIGTEMGKLSRGTAALGKGHRSFWREIAHCMHLLEVGTYYCYIGTWRRI